jgi:hypothetical protein
VAADEKSDDNRTRDDTALEPHVLKQLRPDLGRAWAVVVGAQRPSSGVPAKVGLLRLNAHPFVSVVGFFGISRLPPASRIE